MAKLLLIETSTALCSTAISDGEKIICERRSDEPRQHASMTAVYVKEMLDECGLTMADINAVALSAGPGSYTGLRVGSSTAKGLCFGAGKPLISVGTLDVLAWQAIGLGLPEGCSAILPMIDARRMEVYSAVYSPEGKRLTEIAPIVVEESSFADVLAGGPVIVIGDAAEKCSFLPAARFVQCCPDSKAMLAPAIRKFEAGEFEDIAYFEPFYLKDFVATVGKKLF